MAKSTIKNDPFALVIPEAVADEVSDSPKESRGAQPKSAKKEKLTVHLYPELIERVKNAAYWNPRLTIAAIAEIGIAYAMEQVEKENGGPYPPRESELKGGRPIGRTRSE